MVSIESGLFLLLQSSPLIAVGNSQNLLFEMDLRITWRTSEKEQKKCTPSCFGSEGEKIEGNIIFPQEIFARPFWHHGNWTGHIWPQWRFWANMVAFLVLGNIKLNIRVYCTVINMTLKTKPLENITGLEQLGKCHLHHFCCLIPCNCFLNNMDGFIHQQQCCRLYVFVLKRWKLI